MKYIQYLLTTSPTDENPIQRCHKEELLKIQDPRFSGLGLALSLGLYILLFCSQKRAPVSLNNASLQPTINVTYSTDESLHRLLMQAGEFRLSY